MVATSCWPAIAATLRVLGTDRVRDRIAVQAQRSARQAHPSPPWHGLLRSAGYSTGVPEACSRCEVVPQNQAMPHRRLVSKRRFRGFCGTDIALSVDLVELIRRLLIRWSSVRVTQGPPKTRHVGDSDRQHAFVFLRNSSSISTSQVVESPGTVDGHSVRCSRVDRAPPSLNAERRMRQIAVVANRRGVAVQIEA